ncbi:hypothetical protein [Aquibacillus kalidii]|uniref:hypothetical protein n=1 Tax=Aquibacillus kalidii TaxID=2762597 RepID=UPI001645E77E|nr:hypothetical protein [Aquibacillus kalidii]
MNGTEPTRKLLRLTIPNAYKILIDELESHHIHAYDIRALCYQASSTIDIEIQFGENFTHTMKESFEEKKLEKNPDFINFCRKIGETCKETLIADYFRMVKP